MGLWTELALKLYAAKQTGRSGESDRAMADLAPFITQTARRIHGSCSKLRQQRAQDFIAIAPSLVWSKIEKFQGWYERELNDEARSDPSKEWFSAWCVTELRYRYLDQGRAQADEQRMTSLDGAAPVAAPETDVPGESGEFELSPDEVRRLAAWDPLDAVITFCLSHQWDKVPAALWNQWLGELGLAAPFPPDAFIRAPKKQKRQVLADALGVSRDVIYQRWLRLKARFKLNEKTDEE